MKPCMTIFVSDPCTGADLLGIRAIVWVRGPDPTKMWSWRSSSYGSDTHDNFTEINLNPHHGSCFVNL